MATSPESAVTSKVEDHYSATGRLADIIAAELRAAGKDLAKLTTADLAPIDEFHIRGRKATVELAAMMEIGPGSLVLDVGSGLGGPARTLAELYQCHVTGVDLTSDFCAAANAMSRWVGLSDRTTFRQGDATALNFDAGSFDAAMTIHVAMNIAAKDAVYAGVRRVLKPGRIFAVYDVLQGEGGDVLFPVPWAREPSISHLATPDEMRRLLEGAGFTIVSEIDSTEESGVWFKEMAARMGAPDRRRMSFRAFLGDEYAQMAANQVRNLAERRIRTVAYIARS
jgi:ubiquinone/menaquinone biosynthesis C-methylase UbiE